MFDKQCHPTEGTRSEEGATDFPATRLIEVQQLSYITSISISVIIVQYQRAAQVRTLDGQDIAACKSLVISIVIVIVSTRTTTNNDDNDNNDNDNDGNNNNTNINNM